MGAVRVSMVQLGTVSKLLPRERTFQSEFVATETAYISGMNEVLREVATKKYLELLGPTSDNPRILEAINESIVAFERLNEALNGEKRKLLAEIEEAYNFEQALSEEEWFVRGFLEGYQFIKEIGKSGGGITLEAG